MEKERSGVEIQLDKLNESLLFFRSIANSSCADRKFIYPGKIERRGDSSQFVLAIKQKLKILGFYNQDSLTQKFGDSLEQALMQFQRMHNIKDDGIPGKNTYRFLDWPVSRYVKTLEKNIERYSHLPDSLPETRVEINVPEYKLRFFVEGKLMKDFEVIAGKYDNQTPLLTSKIDYLVFNPCWTIPNSIAGKSILPRLKKDTMYLDNRNMFVCLNGKQVDHHGIDFSAYTKDNFPYKIFQNASPGNALGKVKFMFDNSHSVYLHDTPYKYLFKKDFRTFSSGCIRVQGAMELAQLMLTEDNNEAIIEQKLSKGFPVKVFLNKPIPVIVQYFTTRYSEEDDMVQFFYDCYYKDVTTNNN